MWKELWSRDLEGLTHVAACLDLARSQLKQRRSIFFDGAKIAVQAKGESCRTPYSARISTDEEIGRNWLVRQH
jgi:hypothetical protein